MRNPCKHNTKKTQVVGFKMDVSIRIVWCSQCGALRRDTKLDPRLSQSPLNWERGKWTPPALIRDQQSQIFMKFITKAEKSIS